MASSVKKPTSGTRNGMTSNCPAPRSAGGVGDGLCLLQHAGQHRCIHVGAGQAHADALAAEAVALLQRGGEGGGAGAFGDVVGGLLKK